MKREFNIRSCIELLVDVIDVIYPWPASHSTQQGVPMDIVAVFCQIDDFCRQFEPLWRQHQLEKLPRPIGGRRRRPAGLALSETLTLLVWFHLSGYRTFKHFYQGHACQQLRAEFPGLPGYTRMVGLIPSALAPLCAFLNTRLATTRGIAFIDSLPLKVCHNRRIHSHRCSPAWPSAAGVAWTGSLASSCTSSLTTLASW